MKRYRIYDGGKGNSKIGYDMGYEYIFAKTAIDAVKIYLKDKKIDGYPVRSSKNDVLINCVEVDENNKRIGYVVIWYAIKYYKEL